MPKEPKEERVYLSMSVLSIALILMVISVVALTIVAELQPSVKEFLQQLTGHHWITKGLMALAVFTITSGVGALIRRRETPDPVGWSWLASATALIGIVVLFLFFLGHYIAQRT